MNNVQPQASATQPHSNRTLWIILGSVIGFLVIVMGGCVACGAAIGLSSLSNGGQTAGGSGPLGSLGASGLASSSWSGTLNCDDGDTLPFTIKFSASGNWLYHYDTSSGSRQAELTSEGQTLKFAAAGGGATYITVNAVSVSSDRMNYTISISHERSGGGTMIQSRKILNAEAVLSGSSLEYQSTIRSSSAASQPGYVIPDESTTICRGKLDRD